MMLEDKKFAARMRLPRPGRVPTAEEENDAVVAGVPLGPLEPTLDSDCQNIWQSVGWWKGVHHHTQVEGLQSPAGAPPAQPAGWEPGGWNIALSLNVDGMQPFKRGGVTVTPIVCMILNLPEGERHRSENMLLAGIIACREPKNMNVYLKFLIDELLVLHTVGFDFVDPLCTEHTVRKAYVKLLFTASDYPAHTKLNQMRPHSHRHGCHKCLIPVT